VGDVLVGDNFANSDQQRGDQALDFPHPGWAVPDLRQRPTLGGSFVSFHLGNFGVNEIPREKLLKAALVAFGIVMCLVYPLGLVWPSGWKWHGGQGDYYLQMISGVYVVLGIT
jgi:hypothetical protein